jgi:hypothetical protein
LGQGRRQAQQRPCRRVGGLAADRAGEGSRAKPTAHKRARRRRRASASLPSASAEVDRARDREHDGRPVGWNRCAGS